MKKINIFIGILVAAAVISAWLLYLNYMLFPPKAHRIAEKEAVAEQKEAPISKPKPKKQTQASKKKRAAKKQKKIEVKKPPLQEKKPVKQVSSSYPWSKLQDADVLFALAVVGFLAFALGVSYFQLYWKRKLQ